MNESLEQQIIKANMAYAMGEPIMSDEAYDTLFAELPETSRLREYLGLAGNSPVAHSPKMLSLGKTKTPEEAVAWMQSTAKQADAHALLMFKYDGVACRLVYVKGELVGAYTRGDGSFGENILSVVAHMSSVPKTSPYAKVDGELIIRKDVFKKLAKTTTYMLARSAVVGLISRTEKTAAAEAGVVFMAYAAHATKQQKAPDSLFLRLQALYEAGFLTPLVPHQGTLSSILGSTLEEVREMSKNCPYDTDGLVIRIDSMKAFKNMGFTEHHPHGAVALKHPNENVWTEVVQTIWQVGRSGVLTPVLEVKPVLVDGAEVRRATLHSMKQFLTLGPRPGCQVELKRSGGVIPHIVSVTDGGGVSAPLECPSCGGELQDNGTTLVCSNALTNVELCREACIASLLYFAATIGLDGIGPAHAETFIQAGVLHGPDLYKAADTEGFLERAFGLVTGAKLRMEIHDKKELPLATILDACGIDAVGPTHARTIALGAPNVNDDTILMEYFDALVWSEEFGPAVQAKMRDGYHRRRKVLRKCLRSVDVKTRASSGGPLQGKGFCFTGELDISRDQAIGFVEMYGGVGQTGVTKKTSYLVCADADANSGKYKQAVKMQAKGHEIKIISGDEFRRLLKSFAAQT